MGRLQDTDHPVRQPLNLDGLGLADGAVDAIHDRCQKDPEFVTQRLPAEAGIPMG